MKKLKLLPLLGVGLLALVGCSGSNNEISHKKAQSLYDPEAAAGYDVPTEPARNSDLEPDGQPSEVIALKEGTSVEQITARLVLTDAYTYMSIFHDGYLIDNTSFTFEATDENFYQLAREFQEKPTYTLDGKKLTTSFTGSTEIEMETVKYGLAMHFEAKYNKVGLIYEASYELVVATDLNKSSADTKLRYVGNISANWKEIH